jgi:hypothetical protein
MAPVTAFPLALEQMWVSRCIIVPPSFIAIELSPSIIPETISSPEMGFFESTSALEYITSLGPTPETIT